MELMRYNLISRPQGAVICGVRRGLNDISLFFDPQKAVLISDVSELHLNNESLMLIKKNNKSFPDMNY